MSNEELLIKYEELKSTFSKTLCFLGYDDLPLNAETLELLNLELQDKTSIVLNISDKEKILLFIIDFYGTFLSKFFPTIEKILSENETDIMLSQKLNPLNQNLTKDVKQFIIYMFKKYNLTDDFLYKDGPLIKDLTNFKSVFIKKRKLFNNAENEKPVEFDYNIDSWNQKKQKLQNIVESCKGQVTTILGSDYYKYIDGFECAMIKKDLKKAILIYNEIYQSNFNEKKK